MSSALLSEIYPDLFELTRGSPYLFEAKQSLITERKEDGSRRKQTDGQTENSVYEYGCSMRPPACTRVLCACPNKTVCPSVLSSRECLTFEPVPTTPFLTHMHPTSTSWTAVRRDLAKEKGPICRFLSKVRPVCEEREEGSVFSRR